MPKTNRATIIGIGVTSRVLRIAKHGLAPQFVGSGKVGGQGFIWPTCSLAKRIQPSNILHVNGSDHVKGTLPPTVTHLPSPSHPLTSMIVTSSRGDKGFQPVDLDLGLG